MTFWYGFAHSFGAALLDQEGPWQVRYRTEPYLLTLQAYYERDGDVPNFVFHCEALVDEESERTAIYYGDADTIIYLAYAFPYEIIEFVKANSER